MITRKWSEYPKPVKLGRDAVLKGTVRVYLFHYNNLTFSAISLYLNIRIGGSRMLVTQDK
jgi:hypothetical protein